MAQSGQLRPLTYDKVHYDVNEMEGLDPYCWECTSHRCRASNGTILCSREGFRYMHRWVYWKEYGEIPDVVEHLCGNRSCLNPAHLVGRTLEEAKRLRLPAGPGRPPKPYGSMYRRTVSPEKLIIVRKMIAEGVPAYKIGKELGIDPKTIKCIARGSTYRHE